MNAEQMDLQGQLETQGLGTGTHRQQLWVLPDTPRGFRPLLNCLASADSLKFKNHLCICIHTERHKDPSLYKDTYICIYILKQFASPWQDSRGSEEFAVPRQPNSPSLSKEQPSSLLPPPAPAHAACPSPLK